MKRKLLLLSMLLVGTFSYAQKIRRVTNLPGAAVGVNTYANVNAAIAAAANGDIIYIEPSATPYAGFTVTKTLHFIGNGNFLEQNANTPSNKTNSYIEGSVYFNAGSYNSTVMGLFFNYSVQVSGTSAIQFKKNRFNSGIYLSTSTSGILVAENFIKGDVEGSSNTTSAQNTLVRNNIINGQIRYLFNSVIENNTITSYYYGYYLALDNNVGCTITNNIVDRRSYGIHDILADNQLSKITNNVQLVLPGTTIPATNPDINKNFYTTDVSNIFLAPDPWDTDPIKDSNFKLKTGSKAIGKGVGGVDAGAYGNVFPYTLSGLPNIPIITSAVSSTAGSNTVPLKVTISVRSN